MKKPIPRDIIIKLPKTNDKEQILSSQSGGAHYIQRNKDKNDSRLLIGKTQARRQQNNILKIQKGKKLIKNSLPR